MSLSTSVKTALLAGVFGLSFVATATAQDSAAESVVVTAPHYERHGAKLNGDPGIETLSREISHSDLDIGTPDGARELRHRVRDTARAICEELIDESVSGGAVLPCYRKAEHDAMVRADAAIRTARSEGYYRASYESN